MFQPRTGVLLLALITSVVAPSMAHAQGVLELRACNRGSVPVQVVVAHAQGTFVYSWRVVGKTIAAGWCDEFPGGSLEALIAFGAKDSRGRFVSLKPTSLPDLGDRATTLAEIAKNGGQLRTPVLSRDNRTICVAPTNTFYSTSDTRIPTPAECPQLTLPDVGTLVPIATSYYFSAPPGVLTMYHVNVRANPDRGEVTMIEADMNDVDRASAASIPDTTNAPQTRSLLGFTTTLPGDKSPVGVVEFQSNLARARLAEARRLQKDPRATRLEVEDAMIVTIEKNASHSPIRSSRLRADFARCTRRSDKGFKC